MCTADLYNTRSLIMNHQELCPTEKCAVAWIQSFPEPIYRKSGGKGSGLPYPGEKSQLEPSRDGENMRRDIEVFIQISLMK